MVDEREDRYEGEEGEYHFSDDQMNYDEVEAPKAAQAAVSVKKSIVEKLSNLSPARRMLLAGVVFFVLIGVVYKMLLPSSASLNAEMSEIVPAKKTSNPPITAVKSPALTPVVSQEQPVISSPPPTMAQPPQSALPVTPSNPMAAAEPPSTMPPPQPEMAQPGMAANTTVVTQQITPSTSAPYSVPQGMPTSIPTSPPSGTVSPPIPVPVSQNVVDRVKAVEDHNTAMMNLLQTEYAQKISDFEMQSNLARSKMDEMSKRINRIEASLNQITQLLQQNAPTTNKAQSMPMDNFSVIPGSRTAVPRITYTVQAIIPGRAWLKADTGDTVTVAEGDTLRDYGRISKIDPYDGVVEIDTGSKIIALSYGMSAE